MIKPYLVFILFLILPLSSQAQFGFEQEDKAKSPARWKASVIQKSDSIFTIFLTANIGNGWHLPSQTKLKEGENGPIPTEFNFKFVLYSTSELDYHAGISIFRRDTTPSQSQLESRFL